MAVTVQIEGVDRSSVTVRCDRCSRSAATDVMPPEAFIEMIGWRMTGDGVLCASCQTARARPPRAAGSGVRRWTLRRGR